MNFSALCLSSVVAAATNGLLLFLLSLILPDSNADVVTTATPLINSRHHLRKSNNRELQIEDDKECVSITDYVCSDGKFSSFCEAIQASDDLVDKLSNGEWTIFAPTNDAFHSSRDALESYFGSGNDDSDGSGDDSGVEYIIKFHLIEEKTLLYNDLICTETIDSYSNDEKSRTKCGKYKNEKGISVTEKYQAGQGNIATKTMPKIVFKDVMTCNGVIHVVDKVLLPKLRTLDDGTSSSKDSSNDILSMSEDNKNGSTNVLVVYYSDDASKMSNTKLMANAIGDGASSTGATVKVKVVSEVNAKEDITDWADAVVLGSGVINGNPHPDIIELINSFDFMGDYSNKVGSAFVTAGGVAAGATATLTSMEGGLRIFGMATVGGSSWENSGGTVGVTTGDEFLDHEERDLDLSRNQGIRVASLATTIKMDQSCKKFVPANLLVVYYSDDASKMSNTKLMANAIGTGASSTGATVKVKVVSEVNAKEDIVDWADAIILGSGVINGNPHPDILELINSFDFMGDYSNKVGSAFVTAGGVAAGATATLASMEGGLRIFGMATVGGSSWENSGGTVGVTTGDEVLDHEEHDLDLSQDQGKRVASLATSMKMRRLCNE